jgi:hypothetical protein
VGQHRHRDLSLHCVSKDLEDTSTILIPSWWNPGGTVLTFVEPLARYRPNEVVRSLQKVGGRDTREHDARSLSVQNTIHCRLPSPECLLYRMMQVMPAPRTWHFDNWDQQFPALCLDNCLQRERVAVEHSLDEGPCYE